MPAAYDEEKARRPRQKRRQHLHDPLVFSCFVSISIRMFCQYVLHLHCHRAGLCTPCIRYASESHRYSNLKSLFFRWHHPFSQSK